MATWIFKSPSRLEVLLLIQQHNKRHTAPAQQIALDLTEDEKFRLKVLEGKQVSIKRNHDKMQDKAYSLFPFLEKVLNFNSKDDIINYDRDGFIAATKNLLQTLEDEKFNDENAKRAVQRAKSMAEDVRGADKLQRAADQSYKEAVKKVEAGRQIQNRSQSPREISATNDNSLKTDARQPRACSKKYEDRKPADSPTRAKHDTPLGQSVKNPQNSQGSGQSSKEYVNAVSPAPTTKNRPLKPALKRQSSRQSSQSLKTWIPQRVSDNQPMPMTERERILMEKQERAHEEALRLHSEIRAL